MQRAAETPLSEEWESNRKVSTENLDAHQRLICYLNLVLLQNTFFTWVDQFCGGAGQFFWREGQIFLGVGSIILGVGSMTSQLSFALLCCCHTCLCLAGASKMLLQWPQTKYSETNCCQKYICGEHKYMKNICGEHKKLHSI